MGCTDAHDGNNGFEWTLDEGRRRNEQREMERKEFLLANCIV